MEMTEEEPSDYSSYRACLKRMLITVGIWPAEKENPFHRIFLIIQVLLNMWTVCIMGNFVRVNSSNVPKALKAISVMTGYLSSLLKTLCIFANRKEVDELHHLLDPHFYKLLNNPRYSRIVINEVSFFRNLMRVLGCMFAYSTFTFIITPMLMIYKQHQRNVYPIKYLLMIPSVYPWEITPNGVLYKLHYVMEASSLILTVCVAVGIDSLFNFYIFQIVGHFREMTYRISHIDEKNECKSAIRECVVQHVVLMRCRDILDKTYGPIVLWTILMNAIHLCAQIFEFTQLMSLSLQRAILTSVYMLGKLLQTFMYAWAGTRLTLESENYNATVYASEWYENKSFMTSVIIMLTQKPLVLTACKFSVISVSVFGKVVNTALSYFFLLQTLQAE